MLQHCCSDWHTLLGLYVKVAALCFGLSPLCQAVLLLLGVNGAGL